MHYFILALSKNRCRFLEVAAGHVFVHTPSGMPANLKEAWAGYEHQEESMQFHSVGNGNAMFHGQGNAKDDDEIEEIVYLKKVAKSLHTFVHERKLPLVFAGVEELFGLYRKVDDSGRLIDDYLRGNHDETRVEELMAKADPLVEKVLDRESESLLEGYGNLLGTGRTSDDLEMIAAAAVSGKVDTLFFAKEKKSDSGIQEAIEHTAKHRGRIVTIAADKMPDKKDAVAILRY